MKHSVTSWGGPSTPAFNEIQSAFQAENLRPTTWSNGPGDRYSAHTHGYHKVLYCVEGSIVFHIGGEDVELGPGDRLDLPAGISHAATVGPKGVACMEAAKD